MTNVTLTAVRKSFGRHETVHGVDLEIEAGDFTVFVGPSGCGKSTLLRMIAGLEETSSGAIEIDGVNVTDEPPSKRGVAMVFQSYALYPHMTVYENMAFGLKLAQAGKDDIRRRVERAARILQLDQLLHRLPKALSGGQRQRVAIGRAIVRNPKVFLFDEPLSNLDAALRVQMRIEIAKLHEDLGTTMIYVTHDQVEAMTLADRIVVLNGGRIEQVGAPLELYHAPRNVFVAGFIGSPKMNLMPGTLSADADGKALATPWGCKPVRLAAAIPAAATWSTARPVVFGIRPEHIELCGPERAHASGKVVVAERLGNETFIHLDIGLPEGRLLLVRADADVPRTKGESLSVAFPKERAHLFDEAGARMAFLCGAGQ
ncbi:ABC transporter ATP-binding protein [Pseudoduganella namucuonensis]|uniref:Multiple sugar transport system ATP-binding protein n=1 Tax=Pseudoduganella namucuonensis TaxID=1035707 RepID=A0A1I7JXH2_9BURK|nr:sn-glycerol-3-phosphate ABC transporter ATP-binding protein UgpC [Pseudoduganella namucuonensis]SFU89745.1 multiple sugar transport system ATP-binding protein [Pseudoduganella namucuonensis]